jgi:hypothetical protein
MTAAKGQGAETMQRAIGCRRMARLPMPDLSGHTRESGYPVRRDTSAQALASFDDWIAAVAGDDRAKCDAHIAA